ncbi:MAG: acyltransferase domain-containing protein, partial [Desulfovibrio sp.]|nr:acyltransferase domain-containing protein [Desulfovibrio sp.]
AQEDSVEKECVSIPKEGLWLSKKQDRPPLALLCQGMGALWPGWGRELYDHFPEARKAMDRLQAIASWDVLHLLEEEDLTYITKTRWQIPYLFLVEYAQWFYLSSLGLKPTILMGHSLGELIALCISGICSPEVAWYILDTRAEHVQALEERAEKEYGMLAVHTDRETVKPFLDAWPEVSIANYNTPKQFILSGPKEQLLSVRKELRKRHIPAVSISVSLLFHHPSMRILREHALLRLQGLDLQPPRIPLVSVCKCQPYPSEKREICRFIADLDENPVRFSDGVLSLRHDYGIRSFLELGPQPVLSGLVADTVQDVQIFSAGRKSQEVRAMRELCARLYAEGYLEHSAIKGLASHHGEPDVLMASLKEENESPFTETGTREKGIPEKALPLLELLSSLTAIPLQDLSFDLDLRSDLGLRSSSFPFFLAQAQRVYQTMPSFEDLVHAATVADLVRLFTGIGEETKHEDPLFTTLRLHPLLSITEGTTPSQTAFLAQNVKAMRFALHIFSKTKDTRFIVQECAHLLPDMLLALPLHVTDFFFDQDIFAEERRLFESLFPKITHQCHVIHGLSTLFEKVDILLLLCPKETAAEEIGQALLSLSGKEKKKLLCLRTDQNSFDRSSSHRFFRTLLAFCLQKNIELHCIDCLFAKRHRFEEIGEMLLKETFQQESRHVLWLQANQAASFLPPDTSLPKKPTTKDRERALPHLPPPVAASNALLRFSHCVPERLGKEAFQSQGFESSAYFSLHSDPILAGCSHLPFFHVVAPFLASAQTMNPALTFVGFSDVRFNAPLPPLGPGLAPRGRYILGSTALLSLYDTPVRLVEGKAFFDHFSQNGRFRKKDLLFQGRALFAQNLLANPPLFVQSDEESEVRRHFACSYPLRNPFSFFDTMSEDATGFSASFSLPQGFLPLLAQASEKEYIFTLLALEAFLQGALCLLSESGFIAHDSPEKETVCVLPHIGFFVKGKGTMERASRIRFCSRYKTSLLMRFDAALYDEKGDVCYSLFHLELEKKDFPQNAFV